MTSRTLYRYIIWHFILW